MTNAKEAQKKAAYQLLGRFLVFFLTAYILMLAAGTAHSFWPAIPAFSYWETYILAMAFNIIKTSIFPRKGTIA